MLKPQKGYQTIDNEGFDDKSDISGNFYHTKSRVVEHFLSYRSQRYLVICWELLENNSGFYKRDILVLFSIVQWAVARKCSSLVMRRWNGDETKCSRDMVVDGWVCSSRVCRKFGESRLVVGGGGGVRCTCEINCEHEDM